MANPEMWQETIDSNGENLTRDRKKEAATRKRNLGSTLPKMSPDQKARTERLKKDRAFALDVMKKTIGGFCCQECGGMVESPDDLDWHHIHRRSRGGTDHWSNMMLVERGPHTRQCHERLDGNLPQFSGRTDA